MPVVRVSCRIKATDLDTAAAIGGDGEESSNARQPENTPATILKNSLWRAVLRGKEVPRSPQGWGEWDQFAHRSSSIRYRNAKNVPAQDQPGMDAWQPRL